MDIFMEQLVPKKKDLKDKCLIALIIVAAIVLTIVLGIITMSLSFQPQGQQPSPVTSMASSFGLLFIAGVWYGAYYLINSLSVEFEYIVTNSEIDIDKIMSKKRRKRLVTIDIKNASLMARTDDENNNSVYKNIPSDVKVLNFSAMSENGYTYFIDCTIDEKRTIVLWQPTSKIVDSLWKFNPKAVKKNMI